MRKKKLMFRESLLVESLGQCGSLLFFFCGYFYCNTTSTAHIPINMRDDKRSYVNEYSDSPHKIKIYFLSETKIFSVIFEHKMRNANGSLFRSVQFY